MRPKKTRIIRCTTRARAFHPEGAAPEKITAVWLTLDEFEAVRLSDSERLAQAAAARKMGVSRPTFSRILSSGRRKVADGLVNLKVIHIEGGCCRIK